MNLSRIVRGHCEAGAARRSNPHQGIARPPPGAREGGGAGGGAPPRGSNPHEGIARPPAGARDDGVGDAVSTPEIIPLQGRPPARPVRGIAAGELENRKQAGAAAAREPRRTAMRVRHLVLGGALAAMAVAVPAVQAQDKIYIPLLTYRTGPFAGSGIPVAHSMHDYLDMLNERDGGIGGAKLVVEECETGYDTKKGVEG